MIVHKSSDISGKRRWIAVVLRNANGYTGKIWSGIAKRAKEKKFSRGTAISAIGTRPDYIDLGFKRGLPHLVRDL